MVVLVFSMCVQGEVGIKVEAIKRMRQGLSAGPALDLVLLTCS